MPYYVYIIYSPGLKRFYTGTTDDVSRRILEHNSDKYSDGFTSKGIPWNLFLEIECNSSQHAYKLERFIKQMKSAAFIRRLKNEPEFLSAILRKLS
jgi:putative endonuclease